MGDSPTGDTHQVAHLLGQLGVFVDYQHVVELGVQPDGTRGQTRRAEKFNRDPALARFRGGCVGFGLDRDAVGADVGTATQFFDPLVVQIIRGDQGDSQAGLSL